MVNYQHYTYRVTWSAEDAEYVALCAEFPSLSFLSETQEEALRGIIHLVQEVVKDLSVEGDPIPTPFSERFYTGKFQLRIPPDLHREMVIKAAEAGVSLNRYISAKL